MTTRSILLISILALVSGLLLSCTSGSGGKTYRGVYVDALTASPSTVETDGIVEIDVTVVSDLDPLALYPAEYAFATVAASAGGIYTTMVDAQAGADSLSVQYNVTEHPSRTLYLHATETPREITVTATTADDVKTVVVTVQAPAV